MTLASAELPAHLSRGPRIAGTMPEDPTPPQDPSSDPESATRPPSKRRSRRRRRKRGGGGASQIAAQPTGGGKGQAKTLKAGKSGKKPAGKGRVQKEVSAGGVVYRREGEDIEVVLASRRTRRGDLAWGLAKGGIEPGETMEETAIREVLEEPGSTPRSRIRWATRSTSTSGRTRGSARPSTSS